MRTSIACEPLRARQGGYASAGRSFAAVITEATNGMRRDHIQTKTMRTKILLLLLSACLVPSWSFAATIPAGTTLLVRTNETVSSNDPVGKTFSAQLANDVVVAGKVVLRAGSKAVGRVDSSRRFAYMPVILNVTQIAGKRGLVPVKTIDGFRTDSTFFKTRRDISVGRGGYFQIPTGTLMQFRLAQSVNL